MPQILDSVLRLDDQFTETLKKAKSESKAFVKQWDKDTKKIEKRAKAMQKVGSSFTALVTAPVVALGAAAIQTGAEFEAAMSKVKALSGATATELEKLNKKAQEIGENTSLSATQVAEAMQYTSLAGWNPDETIAGIEAITNLALASGEDVALVSDIVTDGLTAMGYGAQDAARFSDVLAATMANTNTDVELMGETFKYAASLAGNYGYSVEELGVILGVMANAGQKGSQAGTSLSTALTRMATGTGEAAEWMDRLGLTMFDAEGNARPLMNVADDLRAAFSGLTQEEQAAAADAIFGKTSQQAMLAFINASEKDYEELKGLLDNADGTAEKMRETMEDNLAGDWAKFKSTLAAAFLETYNLIEQPARNIVNFAKEIVSAYNGMSAGQQKVIITALGLAASIGPVLLGLAGVMKAVVGVRNVISGLSTGMTVARAALMAVNPTALIIIAVIAALAAIIYVLYKNWDTITTFIRTKFMVARAKVIHAIQSMQRSFRNFANAVKDGANEMKQKLQTLRDFVKSAFKAMLSPIENVKNTFSGLQKLFKQGLPTVTAKIKDETNSGGFFSRFTSSDVDSNALGTNFFRGGLTTLSERGGEIRDLPRGTRIYPHSKSLEMAYNDGRASSGGGTVNVSFSGSVFEVREKADIDAIGRAIADRIALATKNKVVAI